ncbi:MAG: Mu-like prophage major head subunit gpT family protein [Halioglobus sp.]
MIITPSSLSALMVGFRKNFQDGLAMTPPEHERVATTIPSTGKSTTYGWLGKWPKFREWVGDRVFKDMQAHSYSILNKKYESSVSVGRDEIEDDEIGVYGPMMMEMGQATSAFPSELVFPLLTAGFASLCYDGQFFFDTDHPVAANVDGTGAVTTVSNMQAGALTPWFLLDTSRVLKPLIYQLRRAPAFAALTDPKDEQVFMTDTYRYGVDLRANAGYGFWQMAHGSKIALTYDNLWAAYSAMRAFKSDGGRPLNIKPNLLVVPTSMEKTALDIVDKEFLAGGESNSLYKKFEVLATSWL